MSSYCTLEAPLLHGGSRKVSSALDIASFEATSLDLGGAVAQILLAVLHVGTTNILLLSVVMAWVGRNHGRCESAGEDGGDTHSEMTTNKNDSGESEKEGLLFCVEGADQDNNTFWRCCPPSLYITSALQHPVNISMSASTS